MDDGTVLKLIRIISAANAVSKQSASALHRVETYFQTTMSQLQRNMLLMCTGHSIHGCMKANQDGGGGEGRGALVC